MKNTPENKAKFFAQYWGQQVGVELFGNQTERSSELNYHINGFTIDPVGRDYLELKPLSQITDEDADYCLREMGIPFRDDIDYNATKFRRVVLERQMRTIGVATFDFLRSKGYALPWMGISVEEQIEFGWVKLKK